ncbi:MAG: ABC transporter substrate-binding protein [Anaerolineae bacterium]
MFRRAKRNAFALLGLMVVLSMVLSACAAPTPVVVEKEKVVEKPVVQTVVVEKEKVVEKPVVQTVVVEVTPTPQPEFNWKQRAGETITLGLSQHPWTNAILPYIPQFEELTGIKVQYQIFAEPQLRDKMLIALQAGSGEIDLWPSLKSREGLKYFRAGYYEPLNKYLEDPNLTPPGYHLEDFGAGPLGGETFEGQIVGIPTIVEGPAIFYRKDLFEKAGVEFPKTMDDLPKAAEACMKAAPAGTYGVTLRGLPPAVAYTLGPFIRNYGCDWRDANGNSQLSSPNCQRAIQAYVDLAKNYGPPGFVTYSYPQSSALMASGQVCMEIEATNEISTILDPNTSQVIGKVGVKPYPPGPEGHDVPTVLQWGNSINAFSKHKEAAWLFMVWSTSPEMQARLQLKGIASPRASSWETPEWKAKLVEDDPIWREWTETLQHIVEKGNGQVGPPAVEQPTVRQIVGDMIDAIYLGTMTLEEATKKADEQLNQLEH